MPPGAAACYVMAHGAGAGMTHPFLSSFANALAARSIATLRYQFPYMERGSKRVDPPKIAHAAVRAAVAEAARRAPGLALFAGGKSFGGRMTSQAQAASPMPGLQGLVFLGFPLHPAGKPADERGAHLSDVRIPMLFLQGTRDELADSRCCGRSWNGSALAPRCACSTRPTIPFTCPRAPGARTRRFEGRLRRR